MNAKLIWSRNDRLLMLKLKILVQILFASYLCSHNISASCVPSFCCFLFWISILENLARLARNEANGPKGSFVKNFCYFVDFLGSVSNTRRFERSIHWFNEWRSFEYWGSLHEFNSTIHGRIFVEERKNRRPWLRMEFNLFDSCNCDVGAQSISANREDIIWICKLYHSDSSHETLSWTNYQIDSTTRQYCEKNPKKMVSTQSN